MNIKHLLKVLKEVTKFFNEKGSCNLGYLMKAYKLDYDECIWILERLCKKPTRVTKNHKNDIVYVEI